MKKISLFSFLFFIIDRIIKIFITSSLIENKKNIIINNFFSLTYVKNKGAAFSILNGKVIFLIVITILFLYFIYKSIKKENIVNVFDIITYSLLIGGILGNLFDRVIYGYVIDYLDFILFNYNFAIFNLSDIFIVVSVMLLIYKEFKLEKKNE